MTMAPTRDTHHDDGCNRCYYADDMSRASSEAASWAGSETASGATCGHAGGAGAGMSKRCRTPSPSRLRNASMTMAPAPRGLDVQAAGLRGVERGAPGGVRGGNPHAGDDGDVEPVHVDDDYVQVSLPVLEIQPAYMLGVGDA